MGHVAAALVACGLQREARILGGEGITAIAGGGHADRLETLLDAVAPRAARIISAGLAGALDPALQIGDIVMATTVVPTPDGIETDLPDAVPAPDIAELRTLLPKAGTGSVYADGTAIGSVANKAAIFKETKAIAVDMESHIAARVATRHRLPFLAIRVISDTALDTLPPAALAGMAPDGGMAIRPVLASLLGNPAQLPALIRTARGAETAFARLRHVRHALVCLGIGGTDLGELPLDM